MILAYLIDPARSEYLLDDLAAEYAVEAVAEPEAEEETARLVRHAAVTLRLRDPLLERVRERGAEPLYRDVEMPLTGVLARMEEAGVRIDTYRMGEITARLADRVEELEARAYELAGEEFVLGSPQQLGRILFEKLELTPGRKGKTGYSTDTKVLRSIRDEHEIVAVIEEWRELSKLLNTYLAPLPDMIGEDGRLHTTFNQTVAATGRLSTTNPNLQSIPIRTELGREIRSAFVAEPGARLISADYSQIELRILAHVSGEPKLREAFERGEDIHTATAAEVLGVDPAKLTPGERSIAKMINFGIVYGISAFGLSENLEIPREQAQEYIDAYLARFPLVQDFISRTIEQAERDGYVTSLLGRRRPVPELRVRNRATRGFGERVAVNFVMQGSNADIIKVAMVAIERRLREEGRSARLVLQVHDELLLEVARRRDLGGEGARARGDVLGLPARPAARGRRGRRRLLGRREELTPRGRATLALPFRPACRVEGSRERVVATGTVRARAVARSRRDGCRVPRVGPPAFPAGGDQDSRGGARLGDPVARERFAREAALAGRLGAHPHIVTASKRASGSSARTSSSSTWRTGASPTGCRRSGTTAPLEGPAMARTDGRRARPRPRVEESSTVTSSRRTSSSTQTRTSASPTSASLEATARPR